MPPQVETTLAGVATVKPAGRLSMKFRLLAAIVLALLSIVNVSVIGEPIKPGFGAKLLENRGDGFTNSMSDALFPDTPMPPTTPLIADVALR